MSDNNQNAKIKVFQIEDNPVDVKLVEEMLSINQGSHFDHKSVTTLRDALEFLSTENPDLILLDLSLPDSHGLESLIRIREKVPDIPIIILTGLESEEIGIQAMRAGGQDYINKGKITDSGLERCIRYTVERRRVETDFRESEARFEKLVDQNADGMVLVNSEGIVVFANPAMQSLTGIDPSELMGAPFGFPLLSGKTAEIDFYHKQKGPLVAEMRVVELEWKGDMVYLAALRDISERKNSEIELKVSQAMLIETEKIGALGTLVAGIAHELNNPMMGMLNYAQYCLKHVPKPGKVYSILEDMVRETERCADIVKNLLTFSRMDKAGNEKYDKIHWSIIVDRVIGLFQYRIDKENIAIERSGEDDLPKIFAKTGNLQQVLLNLIGNALDALSDVKDKVIQIRAVSETDAIRIDISDNGCGIAKKHLATIFDPFFTTKPPGKGTGLGLSVCRSIVEDHNGKISCESMPGKGTTFSVRLPHRFETSGG